MRSLCLFLLTCSAVVPSAAAQTHSLHLPDMPLAGAITLLADQTDTVIIAEAADLDGLSSKSLSGDMYVEEALTALLSGTSLSVSQDANGVWIVRRQQPESSTSERPTYGLRAIRRSQRPTQTIDLPRTYDTVIVTGSRSGLEAWESLSPVDVLAQTDLAAPVSDDLADVRCICGLCLIS